MIQLYVPLSGELRKNDLVLISEEEFRDPESWVFSEKVIFLTSFPHTQTDVKLSDVSYRPRLCEFSFQNVVQLLGLVMVFTLIKYWTLNVSETTVSNCKAHRQLFEDVMKFTFISVHRLINYRVKLCPSFL